MRNEHSSVQKLLKCFVHSPLSIMLVLDKHSPFFVNFFCELCLQVCHFFLTL